MTTGQSEYNFSNLILKKRKVIDMEISTLIEPISKLQS
jgi:hypothetical protein